MMRPLAAILALATLSGCADFATIGAAGIERRKIINDMQARGTLAAVCDISLGAFMRELNNVEQQYALMVCGDMNAMVDGLIRLEAREW